MPRLADRENGSVWDPRRVVGEGGRRRGFPLRNLRRALFLLLALMAVIALKRSSGGFFRNVLDVVTPPAVPASTATANMKTTPPAPEPLHTTVHLQPRPATPPPVPRSP
jgi:hypothetical protein